MAQRKRIKQQKPEETEKTDIRRKKAQQPDYDSLKTQDEHDVYLPVKPSIKEHADLLANAHSDIQRANLVIHLQQTYGNRYVQGLLNSKVVQAKLTVNPPDDAYEREADKVAEAATQIPASQVQRQPVEEEEEIQPKTASEAQRQEEEEEVQAKAVSSQPLSVSGELERQINAERGNGQPIPEESRAPIEQTLGADLSGIKVHTDANADALSQSLQARAFTTGKDIFFKSGEYDPGSTKGQKLISHELTHVIQQTGGVHLERQEKYQSEPVRTNSPESRIIQRMAKAGILTPQATPMTCGLYALFMAISAMDSDIKSSDQDAKNPDTLMYKIMEKAAGMTFIGEFGDAENLAQVARDVGYKSSVLTFKDQNDMEAKLKSTGSDAVLIAYANPDPRMSHLSDHLKGHWLVVENIDGKKNVHIVDPGGATRAQLPLGQLFALNQLLTGKYSMGQFEAEMGGPGIAASLLGQLEIAAPHVKGETKPFPAPTTKFELNLTGKIVVVGKKLSFWQKLWKGLFGSK